MTNQTKRLFKFAFAAIACSATLVPAAASAEGFDGPYVGVQGGIDILNAEGSTVAGPFDTSDSEASFGGVVGYRLPVGDSGLVLGIEGDLGVGVDSGDASYGAAGIAGIQIGKSSLLYTRVGYGWRDGLPAGTGKGLVLGAGFETKLAESLGLRLDYKHRDLGGINFPDNTADFSAHEIKAGVVFGF